MILIKLTALGTDGSRVMLWFDDGSKMRVPTSLVADLGLYRSMELAEDDLSRLMEETQRASARNRAVRIVSSTSISEKSLKQRLIQRGENPENAQEAVDWLRDLGALDDEGNRCLSQHWRISACAIFSLIAGRRTPWSPSFGRIGRKVGDSVKIVYTFGTGHDRMKAHYEH